MYASTFIPIHSFTVLACEHKLLSFQLLQQAAWRQCSFGYKNTILFPNSNRFARGGQKEIRQMMVELLIWRIIVCATIQNCLYDRTKD